MKNILSRSVSAFALCTALVLSTTSAQAQDEAKTTTGSVWTVRMVHTEAMSKREYLNQLTLYYIPQMEAAKAQGLILSYRILTGTYSSADDFDVMMMVEFPNMAALDPDPVREAKWKAIGDELTAKIGGAEKLKAMRSMLDDVRTFQGEKVMRTVVLK
jgi:hypothetical protein